MGNAAKLHFESSFQGYPTCLSIFHRRVQVALGMQDTIYGKKQKSFQNVAPSNGVTPGSVVPLAIFRYWSLWKDTDWVFSLKEKGVWSLLKGEHHIWGKKSQFSKGQEAWRGKRRAHFLTTLTTFFSNKKRSGPFSNQYCWHFTVKFSRLTIFFSKEVRHCLLKREVVVVKLAIGGAPRSPGQVL